MSTQLNSIQRIQDLKLLVHLVAGLLAVAVLPPLGLLQFLLQFHHLILLPPFLCQDGLVLLGGISEEEANAAARQQTRRVVGVEGLVLAGRAGPGAGTVPYGGRAAAASLNVRHDMVAANDGLDLDGGDSFLY